MLFTLLFTSTAYFLLKVVSALVFFSGGLLYLDSWKTDKKLKSLLLRSSGFFLLAIFSVFHATTINNEYLVLGFQFLKISALSIILVSLLIEPILRIPSKKAAKAFIIPLVVPLVSLSLLPLSAILFILIAASYFRKASESLEKQLKPAFFAFLFLGIAELISIGGFWAKSTVIFWSKLFAEFGLLTIAGHLVEFIGILILAIWLWGYIRFLLRIQLFVMTFTLSLIMFLTITVFYTFLLLKNLEGDALAHLSTDVSVLQYSLESLEQRTLAQAQSIAQNSEIKQAYKISDKESLFNLTTDFMAVQHTNTLVIASTSGEVLMRAEDKDRTNDNISADPIFKKALENNEKVSLFYEEGITIPEISIKSAVPIREGNSTTSKKIGIVVTGFTVDSAFVDGVKAVTGLDVAVFGKDKRAATTFLAPDGISRFVGTFETNNNILANVLGKGEVYIGSAQVLNQPFYTAYAPLKSDEGEVIGMLFVGKLQNTLSVAARRSVELTFIGSIVIMCLSLIPTYFFSRFLQEHLEA